MSIELAIEYLEKWSPRATGLLASFRRPSGNRPYFSHGDPAEVMRLVWVLNPLFAGPEQAPYRDGEYDADLEGEVDELLLLAAGSNPMLVEVPSIGHGRVLYERYRQTLLVIATNEAAGKTLLVPRADLPLSLRQASVVLLWLHEMRLLWEPGTTQLRA